jgi:hypothetical protein
MYAAFKYLTQMCFNNTSTLTKDDITSVVYGVIPTLQKYKILNEKFNNLHVEQFILENMKTEFKDLFIEMDNDYHFVGLTVNSRPLQSLTRLS